MLLSSRLSTHILSPGRRSMASRTSFGIVIWNFSVTVVSAKADRFILFVLSGIKYTAYQYMVGVWNYNSTHPEATSGRFVRYGCVTSRARVYAHFSELRVKCAPVIQWVGGEVSAADFDGVLGCTSDLSGDVRQNSVISVVVDFNFVIQPRRYSERLLPGS